MTLDSDTALKYLAIAHPVLAAYPTADDSCKSTDVANIAYAGIPAALPK